MEHFKLSTSRDFRINGATLEAALHEAIHDGEEQHEESSEVFLLLSIDIGSRSVKVSAILGNSVGNQGNLSYLFSRHPDTT